MLPPTIPPRGRSTGKPSMRHHATKPAATAFLFAIAANHAFAIDVVFIPTGPVPPGAAAVLTDAEIYLEGLLPDPITIQINVSFFDGAGAVANPTTVVFDYPTFRAALIADMDADDWIHNFLPHAAVPSLVPPAGATAQVHQVSVPAALARAVGLPAPILAGAISVGDDLDTDLTDGIGIPMLDAVVHEVGHLLGFAAYSIDVPGHAGRQSPLDLFRFPANDGVNDANPDTPLEFSSRPRTLTNNSPAGGHVIDVGSADLPMHTGTPTQASHLVIVDFQTTGVMAAIFQGRTFSPTFFRTNDLAILDAIGWDLADACAPADLSPPFGTLDFLDVLVFIASFEGANPRIDRAEPFGVIDFSDVLAFLTTFADGCP